MILYVKQEKKSVVDIMTCFNVVNSSIQVGVDFM